MASRFQFSLRSLLLLAITIGALTGFFFARRENEKLRADIVALHDEFGVLNIADPEKAYARRVPLDEKSQWRFRVYVPREGKYRFGVQMDDVVATGLNDASVRYSSLEMLRGEVLINAQATEDNQGYVHLKWTVVPKGVDSKWQSAVGRTTTKKGFHNALGVEIIDDFSPGLRNKTIEFDLQKELVLIACKSFKVTSEKISGKSGSISMSLTTTTEPAPGLVLWLEREPE